VKSLVPCACPPVARRRAVAAVASDIELGANKLGASQQDAAATESKLVGLLRCRCWHRSGHVLILLRHEIGNRIQNRHPSRKIGLFCTAELSIDLDGTIGQIRQKLDLSRAEACRCNTPRQFSLDHADEHFILVSPGGQDQCQRGRRTLSDQSEHFPTAFLPVLRPCCQCPNLIRIGTIGVGHLDYRRLVRGCQWHQTAKMLIASIARDRPIASDRLPLDGHGIRQQWIGLDVRRCGAAGKPKHASEHDPRRDCTAYGSAIR
jgi:hypothetical protein